VFRCQFKMIQNTLALYVNCDVKGKKIKVPKTDWDTLWSQVTYGVKLMCFKQC
jgi:hypothetical protein